MCITENYTEINVILHCHILQTIWEVARKFDLFSWRRESIMNDSFTNKEITDHTTSYINYFPLTFAWLLKVVLGYVLYIQHHCYKIQGTTWTIPSGVMTRT